MSSQNSESEQFTDDLILEVMELVLESNEDESEEKNTEMRESLTQAPRFTSPILLELPIFQSNTPAAVQVQNLLERPWIYGYQLDLVMSDQTEFTMNWENVNKTINAMANTSRGGTIYVGVRNGNVIGVSGGDRNIKAHEVTSSLWLQRMSIGNSEKEPSLEFLPVLDNPTKNHALVIKIQVKPCTNITATVFMSPLSAEAYIRRFHTDVELGGNEIEERIVSFNATNKRKICSMLSSSV
jgi:hypothetical protein